MNRPNNCTTSLVEGQVLNRKLITCCPHKQKKPKRGWQNSHQRPYTKPTCPQRRHWTWPEHRTNVLWINDIFFHGLSKCLLSLYAKYLVNYISKRETCRYGRKLFAIHLFIYKTTTQGFESLFYHVYHERQHVVRYIQQLFLIATHLQVLRLLALFADSDTLLPTNSQDLKMHSKIVLNNVKVCRIRHSYTP